MQLDAFHFSVRSPHAIVRVTGPDAGQFLQGQFSNNLQQGFGEVVYGLWLNQKGRVVADSHVFCVAKEDFLVVSDNAPASLVLQRLGEYLIADEVELADESADWSGLSVDGHGSAEFVAARFGGMPASGHFLAGENGMAYRRRCGAGENFELLGPREKIAALVAAARALGAEKCTEEIEYRRILAGIPAVPQDIGPGDLPAEGGLDETAVSYTKGCYLGQEVMARLKNLGQVRRRLHVLKGTGPAPAPLTPLYQGARQVGVVRSSANLAGTTVAHGMFSLLQLDAGAGVSLSPDTAPSFSIVPHG